MELFNLELFKVGRKKYFLILLAFTSLAYPLSVIIPSYLELQEGSIAIEELIDRIKFAIISLSQSFLFIPVWMLLMTGLEFSQAHTQKIVFLRGKIFFFKGKIAFSLIVTAIFSFLGVASLVFLAFYGDALELLSVGDVLSFLTQMGIASLTFACFLLCLVFISRSPAIAFISFIGISFIENMAFMLCEKLYSVKLVFLPLHLVKTSFCLNGDQKFENYYSLTSNTIVNIVPSLIFTTLIIFFTLQNFKKRNLEPLSD